MPKYLIEREIPGASKLSAEELKAISQTSCDVLANIGPAVQWIHSYVAGNKIYCIYISPNEKLIHQHAKQSGFPVDAVSEVSSIIDPVTAE
ncbi:DUF4242 domain-containing protein [Litoribacter populi]|uniref:DUF4242 domain-containing protein n=1 Tax=Litoribacter populi TaxID=2598460 RepID=UPI00117C1D7B|nr:DUF4242 domain-containing protein [Litoribacter populi]